MDNNFNYFENSGYNNTRNKKQTLIIDLTGSNLSDATDFSVDLFEPLIIDKQSEIYLDNFITFNSMLADDIKRTSFCLKLDDFSVGTNCASNESSQNLFNSIIIPNENRDAANFFTSVSHKAKKFNYICDVNPMRVTNLTGKITDLEGNPIFHGDNITNKATYALSGIDTWTLSLGTEQALPANLSITTITLAGGGTGFVSGDNVKVLCNTELNASTIFLSSSKTDIDIDHFKSNATVTITCVGGYVFTVGGGSIHLLKDIKGRMTAELSIISKE